MLKQVLFVVTLFFLLPLCVPAQQKDSLTLLYDSTTVHDSTVVKDSLKITDSTKAVIQVAVPEENTLNRILADNIFLNSKSKPLTLIESPRKTDSKDVLFYSLVMVVFLFALLKSRYARYFMNLFRVFFNTSLRQSQLTDQLLQAKLPSLLFNLFFILIGSWYIYLLLIFFGELSHKTNWQVLLVCAFSLLVIYLVKYAVLKFTGWVTGYKQEADTYIFIIFLINKIVAICLIPVVIIMAFSEKELSNVALILSFVIICIMLLMRFFRSYSLLQNKLKISRFHFFIYIIGIEIIPIMVIYKVALFFMSKNL